MAGRTFAIGDIHGELWHLQKLLASFPELDPGDTVVFLGDYIDWGARSREVVEHVMALPGRTPARVVCLRGNHEDAWLRVRQTGWDEFVLAPASGCLATLRSFNGGKLAVRGEQPRTHEMEALTTGAFFPEGIARWLESLPFWYEDERGIYVHAGLPRAGQRFSHPSKVDDPIVMLWIRTEDFFRNYRGKHVVVGHTRTELLPQELSTYTPDDPADLWAGPNVTAIDTGCGLDGFLTAVELPSMRVYESRAGEGPAAPG